MTLNELKLFVKQDKWGIIPGWNGYIKWDYFLKELYFENGDYRMNQSELENKVKNRLDLYYII